MGHLPPSPPLPHSPSLGSLTGIHGAGWLEDGDLFVGTGVASAAEKPSLELCLHPTPVRGEGKAGSLLALSHRCAFPLGFAFFTPAKFEISNLISLAVWA